MNEFDIINKYLKPLAVKNLGALQLSDDIFFDKKKNIAISIDTYVKGVHFISDNPNFFLKKVLRSSLSDLYCKGIKPKTYFISFALNKSLVNVSWLKDVRKILNAEQKKFKISLGGGDTTFSSKFVVTITSLGDVINKPVFRNGCSLNDDIYVTGNIGDSFLGLNVIKKKYTFGKYNSFFKKIFYEPDLPTILSPYLSKIASSSIDISDGLAQDLEHLCSYSKFGAYVNLNKLPLSPSAEALLSKNVIKLKNFFSRGDDYQFLFTSSPKKRNNVVNLSKKLNIKITKIGLINNSNNILFEYRKSKFKFKGKKMGYTHNF